MEPYLILTSVFTHRWLGQRIDYETIKYISTNMPNLIS